MSKKSSDTLVLSNNWELILLEPINPMDGLPFEEVGTGSPLQIISYKRYEVYLNWKGLRIKVVYVLPKRAQELKL